MSEPNTQQHRQFKILLIGDDCTDVYQYGTVDRISPEAPVPVFKHTRQTSVGGMARNVKANLEALGCMVVYLCGETSVKTRLVDERSRQHVLRVDDDRISEPLRFEDIPYAFENIDAVVVSDYNKGFVSYNLISRLIAQGKPVFVDTKKTSLDQMQGAWVKINSLEYSLLQTECTGLIVTRGADGAEAPHHDIKLPAKPVEVADVCGAGDTFLSALTYQWLVSNDLAQAMEFAIRASSLTVQHLGNYAPTVKEIQ